MPRFLNAIAGLSFASVALSSPLSLALYPRQNASSPCAQVGAAVAKHTGAGAATVPAQLAYECITSVPFHKDQALALVDGVVPYFRWQSTTVWLKDPPAEYVEKIQDPVDVWGGLQKIREKVVAGSYSNEFEVIIMPCSQHRVLKTDKSVRVRIVSTSPDHPRRPLCLRTRLRWHCFQLGQTSSSGFCIRRWPRTSKAFRLH